jgi:starch synthase
MSRKRVLIVTQEVKPYLILSEVSKLVHQIPIYMNTHGMEVRILMPRFGVINERRHRLHEVVRLSGINIIIDDDDNPLIIKVASLPGARLQVYFLDNEEFFKRKYIFKDDENKPFEDNAERMVFFCKGVMETIKKFGWPPDILHCHGWMTSLIPMYMKTAYKKEAVFHNTKCLYTVYENQMDFTLSKAFPKKAIISKDVTEKDFSLYKKATNAALYSGAVHYADGVVIGSKTVDKTVLAEIKKLPAKKVLNAVEATDSMAAHLEFYKSMMQ